MALPGGTLTGYFAISNFSPDRYDQYVRMALRSIPVMRALADVKPVTTGNARIISCILNLFLI